MNIEPSIEVRQALNAGRPIVALETTLISHGLPRGQNFDVAQRLEEVVREQGAVPATIGVLDGNVRIGLSSQDLRRLAYQDDVQKCSTRDLAACSAKGQLGATTVAATIYAAAKLGIRYMATGGLGGVHIGGQETFDISADIPELGRTPILVFCSGAKAILDIEKTMEALETAGVAVYGFECSKLPGFYIRETDIDVSLVNGPQELASIAAAHRLLGIPGAIVVANPPPADLALSSDEFDTLFKHAQREATAQGIMGKAVTPFLLQSLAETSKGRTVELNAALVERNARLAAKVAVEEQLLNPKS